MTARSTNLMMIDDRRKKYETAKARPQSARQMSKNRLYSTPPHHATAHLLYNVPQPSVASLVLSERSRRVSSVNYQHWVRAQQKIAACSGQRYVPVPVPGSRPEGQGRPATSMGIRGESASPHSNASPHPQRSHSSMGTRHGFSPTTPLSRELSSPKGGSPRSNFCLSPQPEFESQIPSQTKAQIDARYQPFTLYSEAFAPYGNFKPCHSFSLVPPVYRNRAVSRASLGFPVGSY